MAANYSSSILRINDVDRLSRAKPECNAMNGPAVVICCRVRNALRGRYELKGGFYEESEFV